MTVQVALTPGAFLAREKQFRSGISPEETPRVDPIYLPYVKANGTWAVGVLPDKWTYSSTRRAVQRTLGMFGRVWHDNGRNVKIGMSKHGDKVELAWGDSFQEAFESLFLKPLEKQLDPTNDVTETPPES